MYTAVVEITQCKKDAGVSNNVLSLSRCTQGLRHSSVEKRIVIRVVENRNERENVEHGEKDDGMCEKCRDTGRGNSEVC